MSATSQVEEAGRTTSTGTGGAALGTAGFFGGQITRRWWVLVAAGVVWIVLGFCVSRFDTASVAVVSVLVGVMALLGGFAEAMRATMSRGGWRVWHVVLAALLLVAAVVAFVAPGDAFTSLALVIGFVFVYSGTFDVIWSLASAQISPLWWLQLLSGIAQLVLGFFASSSIDAGTAVLLTYVSLTALSRGISKLVAGFTVRRLRPGNR